MPEEEAAGPADELSRLSATVRSDCGSGYSTEQVAARAGQSSLPADLAERAIRRVGPTGVPGAALSRLP
jgi:hypothetical protein